MEVGDWKRTLTRAAWRQVSRSRSLGGPASRYCAENALLPRVFALTPSTGAREMLFLPSCKQTTQLNQDLFALLVNRFRPGYFVEIGANDGFTLSNTVYLEQEFGWRGTLVEANPRYRESLVRRAASVVMKGVAATAGTLTFVDDGLHGGLLDSIKHEHSRESAAVPRIDVECDTLEAILDSTSAPAVVDFISVDVEGGELPIVTQFAKQSRRFRCGTIEVAERSGERDRMALTLENAGYEVVWAGLTGHDLFFVDPAVCRTHSPRER